MFHVSFTLGESGTRVSFMVHERTVLDEVAAHRARYIRLGFTVSSLAVWR